MSDMVLMKCNIGSKAVVVLCPECGRISRQVLKLSFYSPNISSDFIRPHICPICETAFNSCSAVGQEIWSGALTRYERNADQYNQSVRYNYVQKQKSTPPDEPASVISEQLTINQKDEKQPKPMEKVNNSTTMEQKFAFTPSHPAQQATDDSVPPSENLDRKIERWKHELLDTGKRNKMINYRETKRSTLRVLEPEATELFNKLAFSEKSLTFQKPINRDTDLRTYSVIALMETLSYTLNVQVGDIKTAGTIIEREKTLKNLRSKAKLAQEEQGTNILYLCFGFIYWRAQNKDSSPWFKAPLLMMPVKLGLKSLNAPYTLSRYDDEIEVNPTLDYLFNTEYKIDLPDFDLKSKDSFDEYIARIEEIVDKRGWKVTHEVSLGLVSFSKISMYHDLNNNRERVVTHPVLRAMAGDGRALIGIPASAEHFDFDALKPDEWHEVVDSDSSQEEAILLSKLGVSFVMQGPPGTGKSQTITNIIAEALADGKKVLFVSEKAAALEVVLKRLTEVHLDDFCLSLHSHKANKKEIIDSIGANLDLEPDYIDRTVLNELAELFHDREFLTKYADELHRVIEPLGESIYMVFGKISKLEKATAISFRIDNPAAITREQYSSLLYVLGALEKALKNLEGTLDSNPWHGTTVKTSGQVFKQQMIRETRELPGKLKELDEKVDSFNSEYQSSIGNTWGEVKKGIEDITTAINLPLFPYWWMDIAKQDTLLHAVRREADVQRSLEIPMQKSRAVYRDSALDAPVDDWAIRAKSIVESYKAVGFGKEYAGDNYLTIALATAEKTANLHAQLRVFSEQYKKAAEQLGLEPVDSFQNATRVNGVLKLLERKPLLREKVWFQPDPNREALLLIGTMEEQSSKLHGAADRIDHVWAGQVRNLDLQSIRKTLFEECPWMYNESSASGGIEESLTDYSRSAQTLLRKVKTLTEAHAKAMDVLGVVRDDGLEGLRVISTLLRQASEVPFLETDWFDVRKNDAAQPLLAESYAHYEKISELTETILKKWEPEVLNMEKEILAMLGRFKTEHVGAFHRMKSGYKEDIKRIRLLSKEVGRSIEESEAIAFLQSLKEIFDERRWFAGNQDALAILAGSYYRGANTDWDAVKKGMATAAEIANSFPYANIPEDVIVAIQKSGSSIQSAAEIKQLAEILSEENVSECESLLKEADYVEASAVEKSFGSMVLPQIQHFLEICSMQKEHISSLQSQHLTAKRISINEIQDLFSDEALLRTAENWFSENNERLNNLFGDTNKGAESNLEEIAKGLIFAKEVLGYFSDSVPAALVDLICLDGAPATDTDTYNFLTIDAIEELRQLTQRFAPYCYSKTASVSEDILLKVSKWIATTEQLSALDSEMRPHLSEEQISIEQAITSLHVAIQARNLRDQVINSETGLAKQLGNRYKGIETDWASIEGDILTVKNFSMAFTPAVSREFLELICDDEELRKEARASLDELRTIRDEAGEAYLVFCGYFEESERIEAVHFDSLIDRYNQCLDGFGELNKWLDYAEARADCDAKGLASFTAAIAKKNNTVPDVRDAFARGFYLQWLSEVIDDVPAVQSFRRRVHEQKSERFADLDKKQFQYSRKRIRERIIKSFPETNGVMRAGSELGVLTHEMGKKRMIMPLRKLFQRIPNLLLQLKPCLMMSPLSVAYFLDADLYKFDMVIFDEASQIFPQDAIGAIFRAKQVIIAGDTKQLPPTNFFAASTNNGSEGYDDDEGYNDEVYDSILEETTNVLPNRTLLWHYRSKHEHLIAFSNQEIYRNNLVTFPSSNESEPDTGVEFVYVSDGYYEPSPKNYNILEAQRCVQLVKEHIEKHPKRSLGIIAFSEKQQQAIALEIQRFREKNPEYEEFFSEEKDDEFFVKNLENVQGDERDTIFFSVGYAKTKDQRAKGRPMSMRFGPLGVQGGERRLNVAITRAKINVKLVSSILPSDIDLNKTESEGVRMLRSYIEFAMNGETTLSEAHKVSRPDDFADSIAQFIRNHGFKVRQYVGCSGYKIDIAVQHPSELIEQFVAGIECDGFSYASAKTARDRDRLRSSVLKSMGWNLYRVWSTEWHKNPEIEGQKLIDFINKAISECDVKVKALEDERRRIEEEKRIELEKTRAAREAEERRKQREREEREEKRRAELEAAERKRREEAGRKAAQAKAEQEAAQKRERERKAAAEKTRIEAEERRQRNDLSWVQKDARVYHKSFGTGVITRLSTDQISVRFGASERTFVYPNVFQNGLLTKPAAQDTTTSKRPAAKGPDWAKVGASVSHKSFGEGTIVKLEGANLAVKFGNTTKSFIFPDAFNNGFLSHREDDSLSEGAEPGQMVMPIFTSKSTTQRSSNSLVEDLKAAGFTVIDNRMTSSIIWVIYVGGKKDIFERIASKHNAPFSLERRGALATKNVPAWRVMAISPAPIIGAQEGSSSTAPNNGLDEKSESSHGADAIKDPNDISRIVMYFVNAERWRDYMLFVLGINFGLRVGDLLQLRFKDLLKTDRSFRESIVISEQETRYSSQRKKIWRVTLNPAVKEAVGLFLKHNPQTNMTDYLFRSESNNSKNEKLPMHRNSIDGILKQAKADLNLEIQLSTLTLRKTFAYHHLLLAKDARSQAVVVRALNYRAVADALNFAGTTEDELSAAKQRIVPAEDYYMNGSLITEREVDA